MAKNNKKLGLITFMKNFLNLLKKTKWNRSSLERWMRKLDEETVKTEYIGILKYYLSKKLTQK